MLRDDTASISFSDPFVAATFTQYGATMLLVQVWEKELVTLVGAASLRAAGRKPAPLERTIRRAFKRTWKLMQRSKAAKLRSMLRELADGDVLTESLIEEISDLHEWRTFLAHDYLRSQLNSKSALQGDPALVSELAQLGAAFSASNERMAEATKLLLAGGPEPKAPKRVREVVDQLVHEVPTVQPAPFKTPSIDASAAKVASAIKLWERPAR